MSQTLDAAEGIENVNGHEPCGRDAEATRWAVVHTHPNKEVWASGNLNRRGYETFLPTCVAVRGPSRALVIVPLFRGYLFLAVADGQGWVAARYANGVHKICMAGDRPNIVRNGAVEALLATEANRRTLLTADAIWRPGVPCRLDGGAFNGIDAVIHRVVGDVAHVHVLMFGELREVTVDAASLTMRRD